MDNALGKGGSKSHLRGFTNYFKVEPALPDIRGDIEALERDMDHLMAKLGSDAPLNNPKVAQERKN